MSNVKNYLCVATAIGCLVTTGTAFGAESRFQDRVFDATSDVTDSKGMTFTNRTVSDGKGHVLTVSTTALGESKIYSDYNEKKVATVMETTKLIVKTPLVIPKTTEVDGIERKDVKQLGTKVISGHPCKGESFSAGKSKMEVWTGTDINYPVKSIADVGDHKVVTELKSFSSKAPSVKLFEVPTTGYKVMER